MSKKSDKERRPDLSIPDQDILEEKVKAMMDVEEDTPKADELAIDKIGASKAKKIEINDPEQQSAPALPGENKEQLRIDDEPEDKEEKIVDLDSAPTEAAIINEDQLSTNDPETKAEDELDKAEDDEEMATAPIIGHKGSIVNQEEPENGSESEEVAVDDDEPAEVEQPETDKDEKNKKEPEVKDLDPDNKPSKNNKSKVDSVLNDKKTDKAVDDIIAKEADELLAIEDQKTKKQQPKKAKKTTLLNKLQSIWSNPKARWTIIIIVLLIFIIPLVIPASRYAVLNTVGVRGNAKIQVIDESTSQPLKNVQISLGGIEDKTDSNGEAELRGIKLGNQILKVYKRAFAEVQSNVTIKLGSTDLPEIQLKPTGVQYSFVVKDYLTEQPIYKAEAVSGESSAFSDESGRIKLTLEATQNQDSIKVQFVKENYREDTVSINSDETMEKQVAMVNSRKHLFVSNRNGVYEVYSIDIDGKNEEKLLQGTGSERDDVAMIIHPTSSIAAYVSTGSGQTNSDGFKLSTLQIINAQSKQVDEVQTSERIQLIDWIGDNLIYVQAVSGASANNPDRHKLYSYNYKTRQSNEIAKANYFNDVLVIKDKIYYAPSSALQPENAKLFQVNSDGGEKEVVADQEVWNIFRINYDNLLLSSNQQWLNLRIGETKATSANAQPSNPKSRIYVDSNDNKHSLWVDQRDGKGVLLNYNIDSRDDSSIKTENGISNPVYWLDDNTVVYRVSSQAETADYVVSINGGTAQKISDVTNVNSVDNWYFY